MKFKQYINEKRRNTINQSIRNKMNKDISNLLKQTYFNIIPLQPIFNILEKYGIVPLDVDGSYWDGFLTGGHKKTEQVYFDLGIKDTESKGEFNQNIYERVQNATLALSYYKMPNSGKYEVIAYIT